MPGLFTVSQTQVYLVLVSVVPQVPDAKLREALHLKTFPLCYTWAQAEGKGCQAQVSLLRQL